jgi:hypothetical protein
MAKKQTIASEIGSAIGAAAARAEQLIASNPVKAKPTAKRTTAAKHSAIAPKKTAPKATAEAVEAPAAVAVTADIAISREAIAEQAYLYWEARGFRGGNPNADWARAEEELKQRAMAAKA